MGRRIARIGVPQRSRWPKMAPQAIEKVESGNGNGAPETVQLQRGMAMGGFPLIWLFLTIGERKP
jgi:hypothetical protein